MDHLEVELADILLEISRSKTLQTEIDQHITIYTHNCRNKLNSIKLSLYLTKRQFSGNFQPAWAILEASYQELEAHLTRLSMLIKPLGLTKTLFDLNLLFEDRRNLWNSTFVAAGSKFITSDPNKPCRVFCDIHLLSTACDILVKWRAGRSNRAMLTTFKWWKDEEKIYIKMDEYHQSIASVRPDFLLTDDLWSLPILARTIFAHEGNFLIESSSGWTITISLPNKP